MIKTIGWIGTGVMGRWMCQHLMDKLSGLSASIIANSNVEFMIYNRTKAKAEPLLGKNDIKHKVSFSEISEIGSKCDVIFLMLGYPCDVEGVVLGSNGTKGLFSLMRPGSRLVDHTTSSYSLAVKIYEEGKARGIGVLDAPVSGGDVGAKAGKLVSMVGGDLSLFNELSGLLATYTMVCRLMGGPGFGQQAKAANQIMIASCMVGVCEGLIYGYKAGLDLEALIDLVKNGAAGSFSLSCFGPRIIDRDFSPGFYVHHFVKDLKIVLEESSRMQLSLPGLALAHSLYMSVMAHGGQSLGTQSLILALEQMSGVKVSKKKV